MSNGVDGPGVRFVSREGLAPDFLGAAKFARLLQPERILAKYRRGFPGQRAEQASATDAGSLTAM
jgi:hypothetical protein